MENIIKNELIFKEPFNEEEITKLLIDKFLPDNFTPQEKELDISHLKFEKIKKLNILEKAMQKIKSLKYILLS